MKKETILHIPMSEYAHGLDERRIVLRLRAARGGREDRHALAGRRVAGGHEAGLAFGLDDAHAAGAGGAAAF